MASKRDQITWFTNVKLLHCLRDTASNPSIPYLNNAAVITLKIITMIEDVNDTETHFQTLGRAVVALFATAFEVYQGLDDRGWANYHLVETFDETLEALQSIQRFIEQYNQKGRLFRTLVPKRKKFKQFGKMVADVAGRLDLLHKHMSRNVNEGPSTIFITQNKNCSVIHQGSNIFKQGPILDHSHSSTDHGQFHNDHNQVGVANEAHGKKLPDLPPLRREQHNVNQKPIYGSSGHQAHAPSRTFRDDKSYDSCSGTRDDDQSSSFIEVEYPKCKSC